MGGLTPATNAVTPFRHRLAEFLAPTTPRPPVRRRTCPAVGCGYAAHGRAAGQVRTNPWRPDPLPSGGSAISGPSSDKGENMPTRRRLKGRTIAALAADGFEKVELVVPLRALKTAGAKVDVVSLRRGRIRGVNLHMPASRVRVDKTIGEADPGDYDGLLLPGGFLNPALLRQSAPAREFVRAFAATDKPIATLCHGPWVLASAGLVDGRSLTSWPGIRDDLVNAGATWLDQELV